METDTKDDGHDDGHPPCSQACFGTWQGLSYWNSPASPPAPVFPLPVPAVPFRWLYLPVLWWLLYTPTPQKPAASCSGFAGREKLSARNVEQHQSTEMEHIAMWEALGPSPWTEALALPFFFLLFPLCLAILWACFLGVSNLQWSWQLLSLLSALSEIQEQSSDLAALTFQKAISYQGNEMTQLLEVTASSVIREQLKQGFCFPQYCPGRPGESFFCWVKVLLQHFKTVHWMC